MSDDNMISEDDWAEAMCDMLSGEKEDDIVEEKEEKLKKSETVNSIPIKITVELGEKVLSLNEIESLGKGSVIELEQYFSDALNIKANGVVIAKGEIVCVNDKFGIRVSKVL